MDYGRPQITSAFPAIPEQACLSWLCIRNDHCAFVNRMICLDVANVGTGDGDGVSCNYVGGSRF